MTVGSSMLLGGRYRLDERAAAGGMGEVWRGHDTVLDRPVAVKMPAPGYADDPQFRLRFQQEARHAASVGHPNIANVFDYGDAREGEPPYLVMELVDGEPLSAVLAREGALPPGRVAGLVAQVAAALHAAHSAGLVHRDVKPGNLLICPDGAVKVTDFGIARAAGASAATSTGQVLGTAPYLSPEQVDGRVATAASDLYSLGVVAYECLAGHRPFDGEPIAVALAHRSKAPPPLPRSVPAPLAALVTQLLDKNPARRPPNALVVAAEARRLARSEPAAPAALPRDEPTQQLAPPTRSLPAAGALPPERQPAAHRPARLPRPRRPGRRGAGIGAVFLAVAAIVAAGLLATSAGPGHLSPAARHSPQAAHGKAGGRAKAAGGARTARTSASHAPVAVHPVGVALFEPNGGNDDPQGVSMADDGNPATAWRTEWYASADFGNLKPGVGLVFDLGRPLDVRQLKILLLDPGTGVQVWAGNSPDGLLHSHLVGSWSAAPASLTVSPGPSAAARYWLVYFNRLPLTSVGYASGIREVSFSAS